MTTWAETLTQLRSELEDASIWSDASLLVWFNDGAQDFAKKTLYLEDEQYTTAVSGQSSYELPDYTIDVTSVFYAANQTPLKRVTMRDFTANAQSAVSGDPTAYAIHNDALWLFPTPSTSEQIRFFRVYYPDAVVAGTDDIPLPEFAPALRAYIKARAHEQIGDIQVSDRYQAIYNDEVANTEWETKRSRSADNPLGPRVEW